MVGFYRNVICAVLAVASLLALTPLIAGATVVGECKVQGSASVSGSTDLTTTDIWHLKKSDEVTGSATYPTQTFVHVYAFLFGIPIPVYSSSGQDTKGSAGPFSVSTYSQYTRVFAAGGASDNCTGSVLIVVDDQNPFTNFAGLAGSALLVIGLIGLLFLIFAGSKGGCGSSFIGLVMGLIFGLGAALIAAETGLVDPRSIVGAILVGVGGVLFLLIPQIRARMA